jgi:hypothetical protein
MGDHVYPAGGSLEAVKSDIDMAISRGFTVGWEIPVESMDATALSPEQRWKLKVRMHVLILKMLVEEGTEDSNELIFHALSAVQSTIGLEAWIDDRVELLKYLTEKLMIHAQTPLIVSV